jgi:hypothetical protein
MSLISKSPRVLANHRSNDMHFRLQWVRNPQLRRSRSNLKRPFFSPPILPLNPSVRKRIKHRAHSVLAADVSRDPSMRDRLAAIRTPRTFE